MLAKCLPPDEGFHLNVTYKDSRYRSKQTGTHILVQAYMDARARVEGSSSSAEGGAEVGWTAKGAAHILKLQLCKLRDEALVVAPTSGGNDHPGASKTWWWWSCVS